MAFAVRLFGYRGLARIPVSSDGKTDGADSVYVLHQPALWSQTITTAGTTSVISTAASVPSGLTIDPTTMLRVEIPDGQSIRYAISMTGDTVTASTTSPLLTGRDNLHFGPGAVIAVIDASGT